MFPLNTKVKGKSPKLSAHQMKKKELNLQQESDRRENFASVVINMIGKQLVNEIKTDKC